jgi:hypothetical protein
MGNGQANGARSIAVVAAVLSAMLAVVAGGGCEVAIGNALPAFACDPGPDTCPAGQTCDPTTHQCVGSCMAGGCPNGEQCSAGTGLCTAAVDANMPDTHVVDSPAMVDVIEASPGPEASPTDTGGGETGPCNTVGCKCSGPSDCLSAVCGDQETVTTPLYQAAGDANFCTQPCCTSSDCPTGAVCFATAAGGNYCVPPTWLGRTDGVGTSGTGGATCPQGGRDCRSGLCVGGVCADTCCSTGQSSSECASGATCTFSAFPGNSFDTHYSASCSTTSGTGANDAFCTTNTKCESELCFNESCSNACRSGADCGAVDRCTYLQPDATSDLAAGCVEATGSVATGDTCDPTDDECETGFCDSATNKCVDVCFTNGDCTTGTCLPTLITFYVMGSPAGMYSVLACGNGT